MLTKPTVASFNIHGSIYAAGLLYTEYGKCLYIFVGLKLGSWCTYIGSDHFCSQKTIGAWLVLDPDLLNIGFKLFAYLYLLSGWQTVLFELQWFGSFVYKVYVLWSAGRKIGSANTSTYLWSRSMTAWLIEPRVSEGRTPWSPCPGPLLAPIAGKCPEGCKRVSQVGQCDLYTVLDN